MKIDAATRRNLELTRGAAGGRDGSLIAAIDRTVTGGGARLLESRVTAPSTDVRLVRERQAAVAFFVEDSEAGRGVREGLRKAPDLERAQRLLREAGAEGAEVTVWGNSDEPTPKVTQAYADQLNQIGFDAEPKIINGAVYFQTLGNQKTEAQTGFLNWFADFLHPLNYFFLLDGETIQPTNNQNISNTDDPRINELRRQSR